jgi:hypothetical protein
MCFSCATGRQCQKSHKGRYVDLQKLRDCRIASSLGQGKEQAQPGSTNKGRGPSRAAQAYFSFAMLGTRCGPEPIEPTNKETGT